MSLMGCPACGHRDAAPFFRRTFDLAFSARPYEFEYAFCSHCGFVHANTYLTSEELAEYYSSPHRWGHVYEVIPEATQAIWETQRDFILQNVPEPGCVIELGCGPGFLLNLLMQELPSLRVHGYEFCEKSIKAARTSFGLELHNASVVPFDDLHRSGPYDLVVMRHLLEHVPGPDRYLDQVSRLLPQRGMLYIEVPSLDVLDEHCQPFPIFEHVNYFNEQTLGILCARQGLKPVKTELVCYPPESEKPYRCLRMLCCKADARDSAPAPGFVQAKEYVDFAAKNDPLAKALEKLEAHLDQSNADTSYAVYAASNETVTLLRQTGGLHGKAIAVFDRNTAKIGMEISGVPVLSPNDIDRLRPDFMVIGSSAFQSEIADMLSRREGYQPQLVLLWEQGSPARIA